MQLIIHAPFGGRINRAWGLALRKRFCRTFDFELQAAATDDGILLSLGEQHSFPLADIFDFLHPDTVEEVLAQAVLQAPIFGTRFRWSATRALALSRFQSGKRVPPHIQRARAEDLLAAVFPAQVGLPGQPRRRRRRAAGPPAGQRDAEGLPARGDGRRRASRACSRALEGGRDPNAGARPARSRRPSRTRC